MSNASLPPNIRARVVPIIKILDGSVSEPIEGKSGRVYGLSGIPENHERCTTFPHRQTTPAQVDQWLKDVEAGALDDIFQVPFRRFGAYVPSFRLEITEVEVDQRPAEPAGVFNPELAKDDAALRKLADECGSPELPAAIEPPLTAEDVEYLNSIQPALVACSEGSGQPMTEVAKEELRKELAKDLADRAGNRKEMKESEAGRVSIADDSITPSDPDTLPATESTQEAADSAQPVVEDKPADAPRKPGRPPKQK